MIQDFYQNYEWDGRPWLVVGMGPTFSELKRFDISGYNVLGLNKVVREIPVDICQIIDFYIIEKVFEKIKDQAKHLVMPYYPHFYCRPWLDKTASNIERSNPQIKALSIMNKVMCFNLSTVPIRFNNSAIVEAHYFSAEAAISLLAHLGVKDIKLIGVDGGTKRADEFSDHGPCDPRGFDMQWKTINKQIKTFNLNVQHLVRKPDGLYSCQETALNAT